VFSKVSSTAFWNACGSAPGRFDNNSPTSVAWRADRHDDLSPINSATEATDRQASYGAENDRSGSSPEAMPAECFGWSQCSSGRVPNNSDVRCAYPRGGLSQVTCPILRPGRASALP
jgi:hypothetical protein